MKQEKVCLLIQDLLVLEIHDRLSEESKDIVEKHLATCSSCKEIQVQQRNKQIDHSKKDQATEIQHMLAGNQGNK